MNDVSAAPGCVSRAGPARWCRVWVARCGERGGLPHLRPAADCGGATSCTNW